MNPIIYVGALGLLIAYTLLILILGFDGFLAVALHFSRLTASFAVLVLFLPTVRKIFIEVPAPRRDYLVAGIICIWLSNVGFSIWNTAGRVYSVDTSIYSSPIAGAMSLLALLGAALHIVAPQMSDGLTRREALMLGALFAIALVFVLPLAGSSWPCGFAYLRDIVPVCRTAQPY